MAISKAKRAEAAKKAVRTRKRKAAKKAADAVKAAVNRKRKAAAAVKRHAKKLQREARRFEKTY